MANELTIEQILDVRKFAVIHAISAAEVFRGNSSDVIASAAAIENFVLNGAQQPAAQATVGATGAVPVAEAQSAAPKRSRRG